MKNDAKKGNTTKAIIIAAIIAVLIGVALFVISLVSKNGGNDADKTSSQNSNVSGESMTASTKSYTAEEISAIADWWNQVSITNEAE